MAKELTNQQILDALGVSSQKKSAVQHTPVEERVMAGFTEIVNFVENHQRPPSHSENGDIFERLYATRLDQLRKQTEYHELLAGLDKFGLLAAQHQHAPSADLDNTQLLAELGVATSNDNVITKLRHVRSRAEIRAAEEIAERKPCADFAQFAPLFENVRTDLTGGIRETRRFANNADISLGDFFIVGGQMAYVASIGDEFVTDYDRTNNRLRVIYDNGTESDMLLRSLQRALYKDEAGRRISNPEAGPLFGSEVEEGDHQSGTIYVLRSLSDHPAISSNRNLIHKIGVTGATVAARIAAAKDDPTFLLAPVEVVASYQVYDINRTRLENILHRLLSPARLEFEIQDRFGKPFKPREWFLVPLSVIDDVVEKIRDGSITQYSYNPSQATLQRISS